METSLQQLKDALFDKYQIFEREDAFIEVTKDYLSIDCHKYMYQYVHRYFNWLVAFCKKFLESISYKGFVYIFGYVLEIK